MSELLAEQGRQPDSKEAKFVQQIMSWYCVDRYPFPWRNSDDPYYVTVCELLLQRTNVEKVLPVAQELFDLFPTASILANGDRFTIARVLRPLGLYQRVDQLIGIASAFAHLTREELEKQPETPR